MVVIFLRAFDLLFGLRKGEPMFRRLVPLWVIVSTILAGGSAHAQMPFPGDLVPNRTALERLGLERQWFGVIPLVETERLMKITLAGDLMFAQTDYAIVHAFDAESGRLLWSAQLGERTGFARGVTANSFAVYLTNANYLHALDKKTGRRIWQHNLGTIPTSTPACDDDLLMVGMTTGKLTTFRLKQTDDEREQIDPCETGRGLDLAHGRPDSHPTVAGRPVRGLRFNGWNNVGSRVRRWHPALPNHRAADRSARDLERLGLGFS